MSKIKSYSLLTDLIHELRTDITLYNFSESEAEKKASIHSILELLQRVELLNEQSHGLDDGSFVVEDLSKIISRVIANLSEEEAARVSVQLQSAKIRAHAELVETLVEELVSNALAYSKDEVQISLHNTKNHAVIRVEDTGGGLPHSLHESIGNAFFKSGEQHSGRGLGLAIAWAITEAHQGGLTLISDAGKGVSVLASFNLA